MKKIWKEILDNIIPYKPGKPVEEVRREFGLKDIVKLASNENPMDPSPAVIDAINRAAKDVNRYPDGGCFYLRGALEKKLSVNGDNIIFGNGSDEVIVLAIRAFVDPGDEVIVSDPSFLVYKIASAIEGANIRFVPWKNYRYDLDGMVGSITDRTKIIFLANPDNPTGNFISKEEFDTFLKKVPEDIIILVDEAYYEFAAGKDYPETINLINRKDRNIILTRTFSKAYAMAGLRLGYGIARKDIIEILNKIREPFNVNSIAQAAAIAALDDTEYVDTSVSLVRGEMERYYKFFDSLDVTPIPSRANFILVDTGRDSTKIFDYMLKKGIIIRDMSAWGLKGYIRVNMGLETENDKFFDVFKDAIRDIPKD